MMRFGCTALLLSLLVLQKDRDGEPLLHYRPRVAGLCQEPSKLQQLETTFCWDPEICRVAESPWGFCLAGIGMLLMWALTYLATLQMKPRQSDLPSETEPERETGVEIPRRKPSFCACGQPLSSHFQSYDQPSGMHRPSFVTGEGMGRRSWEDDLYPQYKRSRSSSSSSMSRTPYLSSSSSSATSSSSSSSSNFCLPCLKSLDLFCTSGDLPLAKCSLETILSCTCGGGSKSSGSEGKSSDSSSVLRDPNLTEGEGIRFPVKGKPPSWGVLPLLEKPSEAESVALVLQVREVHTQTSIARMNLVQSSACGGKGRVILVEKSLQVQMGAVPWPFLPKLTLPKEMRKTATPTAVPLVKLKTLHLPDKRRARNDVASLRELLGPFERACPQTERCSSLNAICASSLDFEMEPSALDDATRHLLECHVKKKMVQSKCGVPSVVAKSVEAFQSRQGKPASCNEIPMKQFTLTSVYGVLRSSPTVLGPNRSPRVPEPKEGCILSSLKLGEIRRLAFHAAVKLLEIKMGALPEMVENSFRLFCGVVAKPLPKILNSGNKVLKSKHPLLPFLGRETACILDLNVKRKCLAYTKGFAIMYTILDVAVASSPSELSESDEEPSLMEQVGQLLEMIWRRSRTVDISHRGHLAPWTSRTVDISHRGHLDISNDRPLPLPWPRDSSISSSASLRSTEESPLDVQIQVGGHSVELVALRVEAELPVVHQLPAEPARLVEGHEERPPEKQPELPSDRTAPPSSVRPGPKDTLRKNARRFWAKASIIRTSIFLELEVKKEKLNLHFKERMRAKLRPRQGVGLEVTMLPGGEAKVKTSGSQQSHWSSRSVGGPRRSFCYVCVPSDESGVKLKTVCWGLPDHVLEMNGHRTPEVARLAGKSKNLQSVPK